MFPDIEQIKRDIEYYKKRISECEERLNCEHEFRERCGESVSVTGPEGVYRECKKCGIMQLIGHYEKGRPVYYDVER